MKPYDDADLEAMLGGLESDRVERKQSFKGNAPTTVREAVCAFANDLPGHGQPGVVFIGAMDDGTPVADFDVSDDLLRQLADIKSDGNIVPPPTLLVEKRRLRGHPLAVVTVWPCDSPPARFRGRIHVRWGPRRGLASAQDERVLNERRRYRDRPFDVQPVADATLDDLDRLRFEQEYLPLLVARDVLVANDRSYEQRLAATKLVLSDACPQPTVLGLLVIGRCAPSMGANLWGESPLWEYRLGLIVSKDNHEPKARAGPRGLVWRKPECKKCEATDRNRIVKAEGCEASWHMAAKPTGTQPTVNAALVHRQFAFLPGEICVASGVCGWASPGWVHTGLSRTERRGVLPAACRRKRQRSHPHAQRARRQRLA